VNKQQSVEDAAVATRAGKGGVEEALAAEAAGAAAADGAGVRVRGKRKTGRRASRYRTPSLLVSCHATTEFVSTTRISPADKVFFTMVPMANKKLVPVPLINW
jgi:hypothetical protein